MNRTKAAALALALLIDTRAPGSLHAVAGSTRYVINVPSGISMDRLSREIERAGGRLVRRIPPVGVAIAVSRNPNFAPSLAARQSLQVDSVGPVPVHALSRPAKLHAAGPTSADALYKSGHVWGVNRVRANVAWNTGFTGSHETVVAIIDTGIAWNHPDLTPNVTFASCYTGAPSCIPYPSLSDHGTHVAGTVAAAFGGGSVVGVGPNLALASYNVFEEIPECGVCSYADSRWAAMIDAATRGFEVINMSLGEMRLLGGRGSNRLAAYLAAERKVARYVSQADVVVVASAGNSGLNLSGPLTHLPSDLPGIINVAATGIRPLPRYPQPGAVDVLAFYTNFGAPITVAAPGGDFGPDDGGVSPAEWFEFLVLSTSAFPDPACAATASCSVDYDWKGGTSMAAAHVSGTAGLIRDANPALTTHQIRAILKRTADPVGGRQEFGHGIVDAFEALLEALQH